MVGGEILEVDRHGLRLRSFFPVFGVPGTQAEAGLGTIVIDINEIDRIEWDDSKEKKLYERPIARLAHRLGEPESPLAEPSGPKESLPGLQIVGLFEGGIGAVYFGNRQFVDFSNQGFGRVSEMEPLLKSSGGGGITWRNSLACTIEFSRMWGLLGVWESDEAGLGRADLWADIEDVDVRFWFLGSHIAPFLLAGETLRYELRVTQGDANMRFRMDTQQFHFGGGLLIGNVFAHANKHFRGGLNLEILYRPHTFTTLSVENPVWTGDTEVHFAGESIQLLASVAIAYSF